MTDPAKQLASKYAPPNRYANFGAALTRMHINGFRGINDLTVEFPFPIVAFSGLNGSGKSTLAQLAVCAYRQPMTAQQYKRYYIKDFFPVSVADPTPFTPSARIQYSYQMDAEGQTKDVSVARATKEWSGYKREPERTCFYVGFSLYIPKIERKDFSIYRSSNLELSERRDIPDSVKAKVDKILNQPYDDVHFQGISTKTKTGELAIARRYGAAYSENNMGFGEGRILYMVDLLENSPEQSLFVLEEPETSLHADAQHRLTQYLLDVVNRRHHQVVISTHSGTMLNALPSEARCLVHRDETGVSCHPSISATRAQAILSGGYERLNVLVEDDFARAVLTEIVRCDDPQMLTMITIEGVGSDQAVREGMRLLQKLDTTAVAFLDGDCHEIPSNHVYCLPGNRPPEVEVFGSEPVQGHFKSRYGVALGPMTTGDLDVDHHDYPNVVADAISSPPAAVSTECAQVYASKSLTSDQRHSVVTNLRAALEGR